MAVRFRLLCLPLLFLLGSLKLFLLFFLFFFRIFFRSRPFCSPGADVGILHVRQFFFVHSKCGGGQIHTGSICVPVLHGVVRSRTPKAGQKRKKQDRQPQHGRRRPSFSDFVLLSLSVHTHTPVIAETIRIFLLHILSGHMTGPQDIKLHILRADPRRRRQSSPVTRTVTVPALKEAAFTGCSCAVLLL